MAKTVKMINNFTNFTNENWRQSAKLKDINNKTGVFDEEGIEGDLNDFEDAADASFKDLFNKAFEVAEMNGLFGGSFEEYMDARENQYSDKQFTREYLDFVEAYKSFKNMIINDLRDP